MRMMRTYDSCGYSCYLGTVGIMQGKLCKVVKASMSEPPMYFMLFIRTKN